MQLERVSSPRRGHSKVNDVELMRELNNMIADNSDSFHQDSIELFEYLLDMPNKTFSDDDKIDLQLKICSMFASFMSFAMQHQEDYNHMTRFWVNQFAEHHDY